MRFLTALSLAGVLCFGAVGATFADDGDDNDFDHGGCHPIRGRFVEIVADTFLSPNDPLGRVVNYTQGTLQSTGTAILTSLGPGPTPGSWLAETRHLFVVNPFDQLIATGVAIFTPIPGTSDAHDVLTLKVQGGLGVFEGATGEIVATGTGTSFFPVPPGPTAGNSFFI